VGPIEELSDAHDRVGFDCGNEALNLYLRQTARQHGLKGISKTFVLVHGDSVPPKPIIGFFTLNICQIQTELVPKDIAKRLPRQATGVKLGRLAVAKSCQKQGVGSYLLITAMKYFLRIHELAGGIGLFVDAKDYKAKSYYEQFGFMPLISDDLQLFLPTKTISDELKLKS
jgi:GNAT superfamily N-acetyltransferase